MAIRPPVGSDDDLVVYDNSNLTGLLAGSSFSGDVVDFVAQDANRRAYPDSTYPVVDQWVGSGRYQIEYANDGTTILDSTSSITMNAPEIIEIRDSFQAAGVPTYYRVVPSDSGQNPELFLMESTSGNAATYVQGRSSAVASSSGNGAGVAEGFVYSSPAGQYEGLVLINPVPGPAATRCTATRRSRLARLW